MYLRVIVDKSIKVSPSKARKKKVAAELQLRMFHVGEGECILIVFPNKDAWLVDCGRTTRKKSNEKLAEDLIAYLEKNKLFLKVIIPSHPHSDHARAITTLISLETDSIANPVKIFRSDDKGWKNTKPKWLKPYREAVASFANEVVIKNDKKKGVTIANGISAHLFASGSEARKNYRSLFMQLRYHDAKLLFTGDAYKRYEKAMLKKFGKNFFAADVLKITHHGSKGGTDSSVLTKIQPGIAIASTGKDKGHDLDPKTRKTITDHSGEIRIFETARANNGKLSARDVVLDTDGKPIDGNGILYRARRLAGKFK
jgi:beta-lactamase superfamily II metal-dependent hydrolase